MEEGFLVKNAFAAGFMLVNALFTFGSKRFLGMRQLLLTWHHKEIVVNKCSETLYRQPLDFLGMHILKEQMYLKSNLSI